VRLLSLLSVLSSLSASAIEPWSDARLPVTNGVAMWFDASRQTAGRGANGLTPLRSWADAPEILFDGSGNRRDLVQPLLAARPTFRIDWGTTALAFDGTNDHLTFIRPGLTLSNVTVFVVASPHEIGGYRGLLAATALGKNDYLTGFNLDFGSAPSTNLLTSINVEGPGFTIERNLLKQPTPLNRWHIFALTMGGTNGVQAFLDGQPQNARPRTPIQPLAFDEFTLGARRYSNTPDRPHAQGFFKGWLTEVLFFDRVLADKERTDVERYLDEKYGSVLRGLGMAAVREGTVPLVPVKDPPPVQFHFPGFVVDELPVELNNVNNVRFRSDGKLLAIGYDGRLWLLSDTNGDGLEDKTELFFDGRNSIRAPIGAALTPPGYARGNGVFLPGKDRLALVVDTNGDDRADEDITVAEWKETSIQHGVDALGVAVGPDGSVYFSLGSASFIEPFLIDSATGNAGYHTRMERGTILKVSPDFSKREIVATGIRFAVGMEFNQHGDLFVTDQEGATWRHDGNPIDELLHIQPGRHYGFPPRHPRHLPDVFDEPSVFDYTPQHQSTCGLCFNSWSGSRGNEAQTSGSALRTPNSASDDGLVTPAPTGVWFGPAHWQHDALVTGYSRGKLWRTKLVKTEAGYVAHTDLLATMQQMLVDVCVSPRGDLILATHSGQPDWGSGPNGKGKLWRVRYADRETPQPVLAWNASPTELKIAFDRPLDAAALKDFATKARIEGGQFVFPGDRFEMIRPGYQVIYDQLAAPRYVHEILTTQLSPDRRTLSLITRPRETAVNYAVTMPALVAAEVTRLKPKEGTDMPETPHVVSYQNEVDLLTSLNGVEANWLSGDGRESLKVWLPHIDLQVARELTAGSAEHEQFTAALAKPGSLTLRGQLDLWQMLQPAIQPGAAIDWVRPPENVRVRFESPAGVAVRMGAPNASSASSSASGNRADLEISAPGQAWQTFEIKLPTGGGTALTATWSTDEDPRPRAFPLRRFFQPWAKPLAGGGIEFATGPRTIPEIAGGNWLHGRRLFFSDQLACAKCHVIRGEGSQLGPELSNLIHRDYASVRKDLEFPNAAINPDHLASVIERTNGESQTGILLGEKDGVLRVANAAGAIEELRRSEVRATSPSSLSLMPEGLWTALNATEQRDLMTFLLTNPLEPQPVMPEAQGQQLPPARKLSEVKTALPDSHATAYASRDSSQSLLPSAATKIKIILCASEKDPGHGAPGFHDYPLWRERWSKLLALADNVIVETADRWPSPEQWQSADVVAFYHDNPAWVADKAGDLDTFLARGGGLIFLHWSMNAYRDVDALKQRLWRAWGPGAKFRYGVEKLSLAPHDLTTGLPGVVELTDEAYWSLPGGEGSSTVLATSDEEGQPTPQVWLREQGPGRVFVCIPGHFTWTFDDPLYRVLLLRGFAWAGKQPLDRFNELVTVGARFEP